MKSPTADFSFYDGGSVVLLLPLTGKAADWAKAHLPEDGPMFGNAYAIERRFVEDIITGFCEDGLTVRRSS